MRTARSLALSIPLAALLAAIPASAQEKGPAPEAPPGADAPPLAPPAPTEADLYDDLGDMRFPVSTKSPLAQRLVDQAMTLLYGFHHDEAIRLLELAARADPRCAMAWWGISLAHGPHINNPAMEPARSKAAWDALEKARALKDGASERERALIDALGKRYAAAAPESRASLDRAYADAMRLLWKRFPKDADVGALAAEALMDLHPWDLWTIDGKPKADTLEIVAALEAVLALDPRHVLGTHLYIHAVEGSADPGRAKAAADVLRTRVPGAGHLVHMPAHIDLRTGDFAAAAEANRRAIIADAKHVERVPRAGFYRIYMAHNHQFLSFAAMMEGRSREALSAARAMVAGVPAEFIEGAAPLIDGFLPIVPHVQLRFGLWEDALREPEMDPRLTICAALRRYARGAALAALGRLDEADAEARALDDAIAKVDDRPVGQSPGKTVVEIARRSLAGEIAFRRGKVDEGLASLRAAVALEDTLLYDEPPDWMTPVRHALGATLVAAGRFDEAVKVYREDLARFPANGWSLTGLARALEGQGKKEEAADARAAAAKAFARADVKIGSSCLCQPGK